MLTHERMQYTRDARQTDGCWSWSGRRDRKGYGTIKMRCADGVWRPRGAHRVAWELENGAIQDGLFVLHRCDNPPCVNPSHLFLGTAADNAHDRDQKGRWKPGIALGDRNGTHTHPERVARGSAVGTSKLDEATVSVIKLAISLGESHASLSRTYGVSRPLISRIARGEGWAHVEAAKAVPA